MGFVQIGVVPELKKSWGVIYRGLFWIDFPWMEIQEIGFLVFQNRFNSYIKKRKRNQAEVCAAAPRDNAVADF